VQNCAEKKCHDKSLVKLLFNDGALGVESETKTWESSVELQEEPFQIFKCFFGEIFSHRLWLFECLGRIYAGSLHEDFSKEKKYFFLQFAVTQNEKWQNFSKPFWLKK